MERSKARPTSIHLTLQVVTLFLIPLQYDREELTVAITMRNGADTYGPVSRTEVVEQWDQLFLIFVAPFKGPIREVEKAYYDATRDSLVAARAAGAY